MTPETTEKLDRAVKHLACSRNALSLQPSFYGDSSNYVRDAYYELSAEFHDRVIARARELAEKDKADAIAELGLITVSP